MVVWGQCQPTKFPWNSFNAKLLLKEGRNTLAYGETSLFAPYVHSAAGSELH